MASVAVRVYYRADQADRTYGRTSVQQFASLPDAINWARLVAPSDLVRFEDTSTSASLPAALKLATGPNVPAGEFTTVPDDWGDRWRTVRALAATQPVRVHVWGDSISVGAGVTGGQVNYRDQGYIGLVTDVLRYHYGDGGSGFLGQDIAQVSFPATGWVGGQGYGGSAATATSTAGKTFTGLYGNYIRIIYKNLSVSGTFRYRVDGGSFTNVTPPTGFAVEPGFTDITVTPGVPHTLDIEWVSGTFTLHGVEAKYTNGVQVSRCAQGGKAAADFSRMVRDTLIVNTTTGSATATAASPGAVTSTHIGKYIDEFHVFAADTQITGAPSVTSAALSKVATGTTAAGGIEAAVCVNPSSWAASPSGTLEPFLSAGQGRADLVIVALGANDGANLLRQAGDVLDGISQILSPYHSGNTQSFTPDTVVIIEHQGNWFDVDREWPSYTAEIAAVAESFGAALIDIWGLGRRSWKYWNDLGYFGSDPIHPTDAGHVVYARALLDLLVS